MGPDADPIYQKLLEAFHGNVYKATDAWWSYKRRESQMYSLSQGAMPTGAEIAKIFDGYEWQGTTTNDTTMTVPAPVEINPGGSKEFTITWQMSATLTVDQLWPVGDAPKDPVPADAAAIFKEKQWYVNDISDVADVYVSKITVTGEGDDLDDGAQVTVEIEGFGHYW